MVRTIKPLAMAVAMAGSLVCAVLVSGCGKYDSLERNVQYVSDDLARENVRAAYQNLVKAHERWRAAGGGHAADDAAYAAYKDAYQQYAVTYNELLDRQGQGGGFAGRIFSTVSDELPPPPPGVPAASPRSDGPGKSEAPVSSEEPVSRDLRETHVGAPPATPAKAGIPMPAVTRPRAAQAPKDNPFAPVGQEKKPAPARSAASDKGGKTDAGRYVVAPGDNLGRIAKRFGLSEKNLMEANGITDPDKLAAGNTLVIPAR